MLFLCFMNAAEMMVLSCQIRSWPTVFTSSRICRTASTLCVHAPFVQVPCPPTLPRAPGFASGMPNTLSPCSPTLNDSQSVLCAAGTPRMAALSSSNRSAHTACTTIRSDLPFEEHRQRKRVLFTLLRCPPTIPHMPRNGACRPYASARNIPPNPCGACARVSSGAASV